MILLFSVWTAKAHQTSWGHRLSPTERITSATDSCVITDVNALLQPCINNQFYVDLYFTATDPGSSGFTVSGNGTNYGNFDYGQAYYTFGPFQGDGTTDWEFIVADNDNASCTGFTEVGFIDCNPMTDTCQITNLMVDPLVCTSDTTLSLFINFGTQATNGNGYEVYANDSLFGFYDYTNIPLTIQQFPLSGTGVGEIRICDTDDANCCETVQFDEPTCGTSCLLSEVEAIALACNDDGTYSLQLEVEQNGYLSTDSFDIFSTGSFLGTFTYGQNPITLASFPGSGNESDEITVCHTTDPDCCLTTTFEALICDDNCFISKVDVVAEDCEQGAYMVSLDLEYRNPGFLGFQILGNGVNYGIFHYEDLPIQLGPFVGDSTSMKEFIVLDQVEPSCANVGVLDPVLCTTSSVFTLEEDFAKIYVDRSNSWLVIDFPKASSKNINIHLFNSLGQMMTSSVTKGSSQSLKIDLSNLAGGIYIVQLEAEGKLWSDKIYYHGN